MATVTSLEENTLLASVATQPNCWFGLNDIDNEGTYVWADGTASTYTRWLPGAPNNDGVNTEDCGEFQSTGFWNDAVCTHGFKCYLCGVAGNISYMYTIFVAIEVHILIWTILFASK